MNASVKLQTKSPVRPPCLDLLVPYATSAMMYGIWPRHSWEILTHQLPKKSDFVVVSKSHVMCMST